MGPNRTFYPHALVFVDRLSEHWYIWCETVERRRPIGRIHAFLGEEMVDREYTSFPPPVEMALKSITLWAWKADFLDTPKDELAGDEGWAAVPIPFCLVANSHPFAPPAASAPIAIVPYDPVVDSSSGEVIGEEPSRWFRLDGELTARFEEFLRGTSATLKELGSAGNEISASVDLALSHIVKAFFSRGVEQLLWHITALECLLGGETGGMGQTEALARRVGAIYSDGNDASRNERARKTLRDLYDRRNELVHGTPFRKKIDSGQLRVGRNLARLIALRMIDLVRVIGEEVRAGVVGAVPSRRNLLRALDIEPEAAIPLAELLRVFAARRPRPGSG